MDHSYFRPALDPLAASYQLILLDLPGNGRSDPLPPGAFTIDRCAQAIEAIRQQLALDQWTVLGHSGGGLVAATYAAQHASHVAGLIVVGSFPRYPFDAPDLFAKVQELNDASINEGLAMFQRGITTDAEYRATCLQYAPLFFADPTRADLTPFERITYRVQPYNDTVPVTQYDATPWMRGFTKPTLIIHGTQDYRVPTIEAKRWLACIPHANYVELPHTGHFPFLEQPQRFIDLITTHFPP